MSPTPQRPVYLVLDLSGSMSTAVSALQAELTALNEDLAGWAVDAIEVGVVAFADVARVLIPRSDLADWPLRLPVLTAGGRTNYRAVIDFLAGELASDSGDTPVIIFVTDGCPSAADWSEALKALCHPRDRRPSLFVAIGIGAISHDRFRQLARLIRPGGRCFVAAEGLPYAAVLPELLESVLGGGEPNVPSGFETVCAEDEDG